MAKSTAVAYYRTRSAANVGTDKDSERRQREAVVAYARAAKLEVVSEFYDVAVSGADVVESRAGFIAQLDFCRKSGITTVLMGTPAAWSATWWCSLRAPVSRQRRHAQYSSGDGSLDKRRGHS